MALLSFTITRVSLQKNQTWTSWSRRNKTTDIVGWDQIGTPSFGRWSSDWKAGGVVWVWEGLPFDIVKAPKVVVENLTRKVPTGLFVNLISLSDAVIIP